MSLRLGFHYHAPAYQDLSGRLKMPGYQGLFLDSLAEHCETVVCFLHSPRPEEMPQIDYIIQSDNIHWVDIGPHRSVPGRLLFSWQAIISIRNWRHKLDILLIRGPSPLLPVLGRAAGSLPTSLLLVGDYITGIDRLPQPRWRRELIRLWAHLNRGEQYRIAAKSLTFVNSQALYDNLKPHVTNLVQTRTTTISDKVIYEPITTTVEQPVRLLYTGRLDRTKGLMNILKAIDILVKQGEDIVLDLVGWSEKNDNILEELQQYVNNHGLESRLVYHGFMPLGPKLFQFYKTADIYVIASTSEGFPRTIWEALVHGLPVIATRVGSIPAFLEGPAAALLIEPEDSEMLAEAIQTLTHDDELRSRIIQNGYTLARENTLEARAQQMIETMHDWLGDDSR